MSESSIWLIASLVLIVLEIIIPGGVVIFLGISGLAVVALLEFGIINSLFMSLIVWFISSIIMLLVFRSFFMKFFEGDSRIQPTDEDQDAYGKLATVVEDINPSGNGRISFGGTTWNARSEYIFKKEENVLILKRESNTWIVGPINKEEKKC